jgi:hypothetical protein
MGVKHISHAYMVDIFQLFMLIFIVNLVLDASRCGLTVPSGKVFWYIPWPLNGKPVWGSMQITKKLFPHNPKLPKDLSISNVVTVNRCSARYPWRPNEGIMPSDRRWWWSRHRWPQGCRRTWCNDSDATRAAPPRTHTRTVIMMTSQISDPAEIAVADGVGLNLETPQHDDM